MANELPDAPWAAEGEALPDAPWASELPDAPWDRSNVTYGEQAGQVVRRMAAGVTSLGTGALKGAGAVASAGEYEDIRQSSMSPFTSFDYPQDDTSAITEIRPPTDIGESKLYRAGKAAEERIAAGLGVRENVLPKWGEDVSGGFGQLAGNIAVSRIPLVGMPLVAGMGALAGIGEAAERAVTAKATPYQQQEVLKYGALSGATELADALIPRLGGVGQALDFVRRVLVKGGIGALTEFVQEGSQQAIQNWGAQAVYNPGQDISEDVLYNALIGAIVGGGGGAVLAGRRAPAEQGVEAPGLPTQAGAPAAPVEAPAATQPLAPSGAPAPAQPASPAAVPVSAAPDPAVVQSAQQEVEKEVLQTQRFAVMKQMMVAEEMGDDLAAEAAQQQYDVLGQQLASLKAGAADPLAAEADLARVPLRKQLEDSVALIPPGAEHQDFSSRGRGGPVSATSPSQTAEPEAPAATQPIREAAESATAERPQAPSIQEQPEWYFSAAEAAAREKLSNAGTGEQFWNTLRNAPGVKQEELEHLGVKDWLDAQSGKVSKEDLLTHLKERAVQVETEVFGGSMSQPWVAVQVPGRNPNPDHVLPPELSEEFPPNTIPYQTRYRYAVYQAWEAPGGWMVVRGNGGFLAVDNQGWALGRSHRTLGAAMIDVEQRINPGRQARYASYMPVLGGTNMREIVLKTPSAAPSGIKLPVDWNIQHEPDGQWYAYDDEGEAQGSGDSREAALADAFASFSAQGRAREKFREVPAGPNDVYSESHFADVANKIGWGQVDDVRDVNGNLLLRVRAIQDDTRQEGAKKGYQDSKKIAALKAEYDRFEREYHEAEAVDEQQIKPLYREIQRNFNELSSIPTQHYTRMSEPIRRRITAQREELEALRASIRPWAEIGTDRRDAKRAWEAAQGGVPDVPFKKQWHEVVVKRLLRLAADEGYDGIIFLPPSQQITEWHANTAPKRAQFFQNFYGEKIPQAYRKWGKALGGTVEQFTFQAEETTALSSGSTQTMTWEGVRVTPEMRTETKRRGVPLFSRVADGPRGLAYVTSENGLPMDTVMRFGPDLMRFTAAMEVMQERYGLNFPIEVQLSHSLNVPGEAQPPTIDPNTGKITKGAIRIGARFQQTSEEVYVTLLHEFGHYFLWHHEAAMPGPIWLAAENDYKKFRQDIRDLGVNAAFEDMIARRDNFVTAQNSFRVVNQQGLRRGRGTPDNITHGDLLLSDLSPGKRQYWLGKEEWMVENIVRFLTTNQQALTTVERYHKSVANKLRDMYSYFKRRLGLTAEPGQWVADWLGQVQQKTTALGEIAAGKDKASQRSNQRAMDADGASMTAVPESAVTQDSRRMVESATANLPPGAGKNGRALAAYADYFNAVYKYAAGLPHLAGANTHIGPLQRYNEINQQWDLEVSNMIDGGTRVLKEWRNRDQPQQDAMTAMIDDYRMMRYLTPQEVAQGVERMPSPIEQDALAAKHGVSKNSQAAFTAVVKSYDGVVLKYRQELRRQARKISDPLRRQIAYQDIDKQINAIRAKPYIPGMQFGNHTVVMRDSTGKIIHREAFDSKRKRNAALRQLATQVPPGGRIDPSFIDKDARPLIGLPPGLLDLIEQRLTLSTSQQKAIEELKFELHPTQSFKHRFSNLNLVAGSSKDFQRGYANFFFHGAHYFGRVKYQEAARQEANDLQESAQGIFQQGGTDAQFGKREEISKYVNNHLQYRLDPRPDFAFLRSLGFLWYLGFVPAAAVLNVTQIPLATMPFLAAKFGDRKAYTAIMRAGTSISSYYKKGTMATQTAEELWALDQGIKSGTITEAMAPEMAAIAELDNLSRSYTGYASRVWHTTLEWSAKQFELAEQFNRRVTFRAAYGLAKANPKAKFVDEAVQKHYLQYQSIIQQLGSTVPDPAARAAAFVAAKDATEQTQGIYKQYAEPKIMRGKARTVLLFKSFYVNTLMMYWNNKDARIRGMLAFAALGGAMGLPFTEDIKGLVRLIGAGLGKDWDLEKELKKLLMGILGDDEADDAEWADIMLHGMSRIGFGVPWVLQHLGVPGPKAGADVRSGQIDMSKSISLGRGLPVDLNQLATASNTEKAAFRTVAQAAGPVYGGLGMSLFKFFDGGGYAWDDRKRYEYIMPRSMKAVSAGFRAFEEGRERNAKGETVLRYDRTDPWQVAEMIGLGLGFQPARLTAEWDRRMAKLEDTTYWAARQQSIMQQLWLARGDPEEYERVSAARRAFNQEVGGTPAAMYAVTGPGLRASFQARAKGAAAAETGIPVRRREIPIAREVERMYPAPRTVVEKERVR